MFSPFKFLFRGVHPAAEFFNDYYKNYYAPSKQNQWTQITVTEPRTTFYFCSRPGKRWKR